MQTEDIPKVAEIDREAFPTQWPPSYTSFKRELHNRIAHYLVACAAEAESHQETQVKASGKGFAGITTWVRHLFDRERFLPTEASLPLEYIVGFAGFWLMLDEAHLTAIAVREKYRRRGIGELLLISVIEQAIQLDAKVVTLEVRVSNAAAQALYEKYGFNKVGTRRNYYTDNREDGLLMSTDVITSAPFQARFQELKQIYSQRWGIPLGSLRQQGRR
jgi:ribosomal-protein-alanine N-acetyltransferase